MGNYILGVPVGQTSTRMSMVDRPSGFAGFRWRFIPFGTAALPFQSLTLIIDAHYQLICLQECRMCPVIPALLKIYGASTALHIFKSSCTFPFLPLYYFYAEFQNWITTVSIIFSQRAKKDAKDT
jgi:hypothetical protein